MNKFSNRYIHSFSLLLAFAIYSCTDKGSDPEPAYPYKSTCTVNDKDWNGIAVSGNTAGDKLFVTCVGIVLFNGSEHYWDNIYFKNVEKNLNRQYLSKFIYADTSKPMVGYIVPQADGDVNCDEYEILASDSVNNWIELTDDENDYEFIRGKYSMTLIRISTCDVSVMPDTVRIRNGEFYVNVEY